MGWSWWAARAVQCREATNKKTNKRMNERMNERPGTRQEASSTNEHRDRSRRSRSRTAGKTGKPVHRPTANPRAQTKSPPALAPAVQPPGQSKSSKRRGRRPGLWGHRLPCRQAHPATVHPQSHAPGGRQHPSAQSGHSILRKTLPARWLAIRPPAEFPQTRQATAVSQIAPFRSAFLLHCPPHSAAPAAPRPGGSLDPSGQMRC